MRHRIKPEYNFEFVFIDLRRRFIVTMMVLTLLFSMIAIYGLWDSLCESGNNDLGAVAFIGVFSSLLASTFTYTIYEQKRRLLKKKWALTHPKCLRPTLRKERSERRQDFIDEISGYISQGRDPYVMRSLNFYYVYMLEV